MNAALLTATDPPAFTLLNPVGRAPVLLVCDHASPLVPAGLGTLGLAPSRLLEHIGWDIGAAAVAAVLAQRFDAPAIVSGYSRLVIDCNRAPDDPSSIPAVSGGIDIPGNRDLTSAERQARAEECFRPYHAAIAAALDRFAADSVTPSIVSLHSFTPHWHGVARPWHLGVLWDEDDRIPAPLLARFRQIDGLVIGDNEPYSARNPPGFTMEHHAVGRFLPHVLIEMRQDEIADEAGIARYAGYLEDALRPILGL